MKMKKIITLIFLGSALIASNSCKKTFYTSANVNPNSPASVNPAGLLSTVEGSLGFVIGGDMSRFSSILMQQVLGNGNQAQTWNNYIFTGQDVDNLWANLYTSIMENDKTLIQQCDFKKYNEYSGIGRVLLAYSLMSTVDFWGKVPYSQAFQGVLDLQPTYDDDKVLYGTVLQLCDSAIYFLSSANPGFVTPGGEDVIYAGSATQWIKFAHAIKARIYIHQSKGNANMATNALAEIAQSFTTNADNAVYTFGTSANGNASWYQMNSVRAGYISFVSSTLATTIQTNSDPRYNFMFDTTAGALTPNDGLANYYGAPNAVTEFITFDELQFMMAEATITSGGSLATAQAAFQSGITASMAKLGVNTDTANLYIATNGTLTAANAMSKIGYEEWVALYLNPEEWSTWRRIGFPVLVAPPHASSPIVPRRMLYPGTEYTLNKANTPVSNMYTPKVFWDN